MRIPSSPLPFLHAIESSTMIARLPHPQDLFSLLPVRGLKLVKILKPDRWSSRSPLFSQNDLGRLRISLKCTQPEYSAYSAYILVLLPTKRPIRSIHAHGDLRRCICPVICPFNFKLIRKEE